VINGLKEKVDKAILRIQQAYEIAKQLGNTLVIAYSGGKDSDVLLDLAIKSEVSIIVQHNHTTMDAPETVYHIRAVFERLKAQGITTKINYPPDIQTADGKTVRASIWNLIPKNRMPPTRLVRYCCSFFKERQFDRQHIVTGVRWAESAKRKMRGLHETLNKNKQNRVVYFDENDEAHKMTEICQLHARIITNPIIDWADSDVWCYIKQEGLKMNPLYGLGFRRVGCIGCPLAGGKIQAFGFAMFPAYKKNYIKAFDRMLEARRKLGLSNDKWPDGESVMDWWINPSPQKLKQNDPDQQNLFEEQQ
jgi:phosphoadenosine phosphosulfate reductase